MPRSTSAVAAFRTSASVSPLLMTCRRRSEPASGAIVAVLTFARPSASSRPGLSASARSELNANSAPAALEPGAEQVEPRQVGHGRADQPDLVGVREPLLDGRREALPRAETRRAVDEAGAAEAAAVRAAAPDLHEKGPAEGRVGGGHGAAGLDVRQVPQKRARDARGHVHGRGERREGPVGRVVDPVERGHVGAGDAPGQREQQLAALAFGFERLHEGRQDDLGLADEHGVHEGGDRFGVEGAGDPARDHQRVVGAALLGAQRDARRVQHGEKVLVVAFEGDRERQDVGRGHPTARLEGGQAAGRGVGLRQENPFADDVLKRVEQTVDRLQAQVGHADRVPVGVGQGDARPPAPGLADRADFLVGRWGWDHVALHRASVHVSGGRDPTIRQHSARCKPAFRR